jgi:hypothetical protein
MAMQSQTARLRFIISDTLDYSKRIARDTGPKYADAMGLVWSGVGSISGTACDAFIIDDDVDEAETHLVRALIARQAMPVLLKVVDPYWRRGTRPGTETAYTRLIEECCGLPNVAVVTPYQPNEWLRTVIERRRAKVLVLPYPYLPASERQLDAGDFAARHDKAILSGAHGRRKYPLRAQLRWRRRLFRRYRDNFDVLEHPGYPDIGERLRHSLLHDEYVKFLAGYKYCFICPSRADLEFLKFTECASAGCVPIGKPASSLPQAARELFLEAPVFLRDKRSRSSAARDRDHFERAVAYRQVIKTERNVDRLRAQLLEFIAREF